MSRGGPPNLTGVYDKTTGLMQALQEAQDQRTVQDDMEHSAERSGGREADLVWTALRGDR